MQRPALTGQHVHGHRAARGVREQHHAAQVRRAQEAKLGILGGGALCKVQQRAQQPRGDEHVARGAARTWGAAGGLSIFACTWEVYSASSASKSMLYQTGMKLLCMMLLSKGAHINLL